MKDGIKSASLMGQKKTIWKPDKFIQSKYIKKIMPTFKWIIIKEIYFINYKIL